MHQFTWQAEAAARHDRQGRVSGGGSGVFHGRARDPGDGAQAERRAAHRAGRSVWFGIACLHSHPRECARVHSTRDRCRVQRNVPLRHGSVRLGTIAPGGTGDAPRAVSEGPAARRATMGRA